LTVVPHEQTSYLQRRAEERSAVAEAVRCAISGKAQYERAARAPEFVGDGQVAAIVREPRAGERHVNMLLIVIVPTVRKAAGEATGKATDAEKADYAQGDEPLPRRLRRLLFHVDLYPNLGIAGDHMCAGESGDDAPTLGCKMCPSFNSWTTSHITFARSP